MAPFVSAGKLKAWVTGGVGWDGGKRDREKGEGEMRAVKSPSGVPLSLFFRRKSNAEENDAIFFCLLHFFQPCPLPLSLLQAFFTDKYTQDHPEDREKIDKLKDLIAWQVRRL